nr:immunoglobulin light chain junction region [Macaca mulatta]MOV68842.1 immunoglobulin light chain junction region [Macaca mulatta]MOV70221.1 immunoglobulin light chain junction region [Macaca mulatta]MOV70745.1 immunoglobulin light chain junction region [Macaca mulatta]MOW57606.1 immunoglobulin light chain junction region [Macaca mulatta]
DYYCAIWHSSAYIF